MDAARCRVLPTAHTRWVASLDTAGIERTDMSDASKYADSLTEIASYLYARLARPSAALRNLPRPLVLQLSGIRTAAPTENGKIGDDTKKRCGQDIYKDSASVHDSPPKLKCVFESAPANNLGNLSLFALRHVDRSEVLPGLRLAPDGLLSETENSYCLDAALVSFPLGHAGQLRNFSYVGVECVGVGTCRAAISMYPRN
jgi:hypothetical protein